MVRRKRIRPPSQRSFRNPKALKNKLLKPKPDQVEAKDHRLQVKGYPQRNMHIGDVANHARMVSGQPPIGSASFNPATVALDPETGQGKPFATYVYATQIAEVDVDDETGEVDVLRIVASHDCGTAINPMLVEGQVEGGDRKSTRLNSSHT